MTLDQQPSNLSREVQGVFGVLFGIARPARDAKVVHDVRPSIGYCNNVVNGALTLLREWLFAVVTILRALKEGLQLIVGWGGKVCTLDSRAASMNRVFGDCTPLWRFSIAVTCCARLVPVLVEPFGSRLLHSLWICFAPFPMSLANDIPMFFDIFFLANPDLLRLLGRSFFSPSEVFFFIGDIVSMTTCFCPLQISRFPLLTFLGKFLFVFETIAFPLFRPSLFSILWRAPLDVRAFYRNDLFRHLIDFPSVKCSGLPTRSSEFAARFIFAQDSQFAT